MRNIGGSSDPSALGTVDKAVDVLFHLLAHPTQAGPSAVAAALSLPRSTAHRLLASLAERGLLEKDDTGRYRLGVGLIALGLGALEREPVVAAARAVLEVEAAALDETVFLVGAKAGSLIVLDKVEGGGLLRAAPRVGVAVPVHASAVGKLFLALDASGVTSPSELQRFTAHTVTNASELARQVAAVRAAGYALARDEWIDGLAVVAAPVVVGGRLVAAVAVAVPSSRLDELGSARVVERAVAAGVAIAGRMGGATARPSRKEQRK